MSLPASQTAEISARPVVLAIDVSETRLKKIQEVLKRDYSVITACKVRDALKILSDRPGISVLISAQKLDAAKGSELFRTVGRMVKNAGDIIKILLVPPGCTDGLSEQASLGQVDFCYTGPFDRSDFKERVDYLLARRSGEKRGVMRLELSEAESIYARTDKIGTAEVRNLSESGMFLKTHAYFPLGSVHPFKLNFPGGKHREVKGKIARRDLERGGLGVKFQSLDERSRWDIIRLISDRVTSSNLHILRTRHPFLNTENMVAFADKDRIDSLISHALRSQTEITALHSHARNPVPLVFEDANPESYCFFSGSDLNIRFKTSDSVFVSFPWGYATYSFETAVYSFLSGGEGMLCLYPKILFYSEKRYAQRETVLNNLSLEISLPPPFNQKITGRVVDISEKGVSFIGDPGEFALLAGTPLEMIRIAEGGHSIIREEGGEIRYVENAGGEDKGQFRYGIQFGIGRGTIRTYTISGQKNPGQESSAAESLQRRPPSLNIADADKLGRRLPDVIRLENKRGEEIVGLLNYSLPPGQDPVPVVLVPPAFGKTKETLFSMALSIIHNLYLHRKPVVVIRYDGTRRKGESYKDPEASEPPNEMINACISGGAEDIQAVLDWIDYNPRFKAGAVILVTFSLSALEARMVLRTAKYRKKVDYWIAAMGTPELRHLLTRVNCGLDLLEQYQLGLHLGVMPVLGNRVDVDKYMADGVANRVATLDQARKDMKRIDIPVSWIYGSYDHWVKHEFIRDVMSIDAGALREVIPIHLGHNARTSAEALKMFGTVASLVHKFVFGDLIKPSIPKKKTLGFMRRLEKDRIPSRNLNNRQEYWHRYLVGEEELLGFDVLMLADDYQQLMGDQLSALELERDDSLLDLGGGTGNFIEYLLESDVSPPLRIALADLIPEALKQAEKKLAPKFNKQDWRGEFETVCCDLEMNRYLPVKRFLSGEIYNIKHLVDRIENLTVQTADQIAEKYSPRLHRVLRGNRICPATQEWLKRTFDLPAYRTIMDFNRAARYVGKLDMKTPHYRQLIFSPDLNSHMTLPILPGKYNKILMSLVLSYLFNPLETLIEVRRILRPGGYLVISSVRPDGDASGLFTRLAKKVENMPEDDLPRGWGIQSILRSIRCFLNDAQELVELEEAGAFDFFDPDKLKRLLGEAGFISMRMVETFGDPPQGYLFVAEKGETDD